MYLKRLELQGFKSFAEKTILEFKPGITSVIGPNGSGKSNISDSIRWVLGEQSMKSLRGAKSEDIIFAGTQNRKSLGFAEVSIVFDNTDGKLPIEYSEVTVTRKIYRSGETGYFINKTPCRLKDILELFMDTGIGKDGYSIIGQGKIDEILSNKSEDRRHIFEEAAGIVKYRVRKQESEKKLEQTKLNLLRINDILSEIESNLEPLKIQSEKAKKFLTLKEELKNIEIGLFLTNIDNFKEQLQQLLRDEEIIIAQKEEVTNKINYSQGGKEKLKIAIDNITNEIEEIQELGFENSNQIEKMKSQISISQEKIFHNSENIKRWEKEINDIILLLEEREKEKKQKLEKKDSLFVNKEKYEKELEEKENKLKEWLKTLSKRELEIQDKKRTLDQLTDEKYEVITKLNTQKVNIENLLQNQKKIKTDIQTTILNLDSNRIQLNEQEKEFHEQEEQKNKLEQTLKEINNKREELTKQVKEQEEIIQKILYEYNMKESRQKFLIETEKEKEGYQKSVKGLLLDCEKDESLRQGVQGVLANLISVEKEYETAIEMCLGQALQNIVTRTEQDAKRLIEHLRTNKLGRASFLPISSIKGKKLEKIITNQLEGVIGVAADLINCEEKYKQIILNLLGRTVVVNNMDTAILLAKQNQNSFRIVTLQGDIINPSGAITGGSIQNKTVNILGRNREIEELGNKIKELKKELEQYNNKKDEFSTLLADILEDAVRVEKQFQEKEIGYATKKQKIENIKDSILKLENELQELKQEETNIIEEQENNYIIQEKLQEQSKQLEGQIAQLNNEIEDYTYINKEKQKQMDDLNIDITNLKISVSSFEESGISINEIIERINQEINNAEKEKQIKNEQIKNAQIESEQLIKDIDNEKNRIEKIQQQVLQNGKKVEELKQNRLQKNDQLLQIENKIEQQQSELEDLKEYSMKLEMKKTKIQEDLEGATSQLWEEYELTHNQITIYKKPENLVETKKQVTKLRQEIRDLGSIHTDAIEEYKTTKERYDFMCEQRLDLDNTASKLRNIITDITNTMKQQFKEKFYQINENFNKVFIELFGGGKAELILTDEDNLLESGIDIHVQPAGKKLQNMMLLSGGEKAFTAIALLFAILKINPAPFCILDEIEAALDDVNVFRYADYLKKFSEETQFLVITHRKGTMEASDAVYGVTMEENGISKLLSIKLKAES